MLEPGRGVWLEVFVLLLFALVSTAVAVRACVSKR
jgi:hypothetical protein